MKHRYAVGIDLGGTQIKTVAVDEAGGILAQTMAETRDSKDPQANPKHWLKVLRGMLQELEAKLETTPFCIGLTAPGLAARDQRSIAFMPERLLGIEGLVWGEALELQQGVPVLNDAHAALLGEAWVGAAQSLDHVVLLTLGTGIGGAIMIDGKLVVGTIGRAGHLGHLCMDTHGKQDICRTPGSLEDAFGECTLLERSHGQYALTQNLVEAFDRGDPGAIEIWQEAIRTLACGITSIINVIDPQAIVLGGGIARAGESLFAPLRDLLDQIEWRPGDHRVPLKAAELGTLAGAIGAARYGMLQHLT